MVRLMMANLGFLSVILGIIIMFVSLGMWLATEGNMWWLLVLGIDVSILVLGVLGTIIYSPQK